MTKSIFWLPKRYLLFVAALVWTFAGGMLLTRGFFMLQEIAAFNWLEIVCCLVGGSLFYVIVFSSISFKHVHRIVNMQNEKPFFLSFFNGRSYIMMGIMITLGITLRKSGIIPLIYMAPFYVFMGIPLLMSSFRFYYYGFHYSKARQKMNVKNPQDSL